MEPQTEQNLTKKELYEFKKEQRGAEQNKGVGKETPKKIGKYILFIFIPVVLVGGFIWYAATLPPIPESDIVSRQGIHWHPEIAIYVKGVKQEMPSNLGAGGSYMAPIHTHEADGVIHLEFPGLVRKSDTILGRFFKSWDKDINSFGTNVKMTVNGQENIELENYQMQDKDKIELRYE